MFKNNGVAYPVELAQAYILANLVAFGPEVLERLKPLLSNGDLAEKAVEVYHTFQALLVEVPDLPARTDALNVLGYAAVTTYTYALAEMPI